MTKKLSIFLQYVGDSPKGRVMDYLLTNRELDFCIADVIEQTGVSRNTLKTIWKELIEKDIIRHTRDIGRAQLFLLNVENAYVKMFIDLYDRLLAEELNHIDVETNVLTEKVHA